MTAWGCSDSIELTWEISFSVCRLELELALVLKRRQAWNSWRRMGKELLEVSTGRGVVGAGGGDVTMLQMGGDKPCRGRLAVHERKTIMS